MPSEPRAAAQASGPSLARRTALLRRAGSVLLWYGVPALALAVVVAYVLGATVGHANPPVVPVAGTSMRPTLQAGDLIVLRGVDPKALRKGEIIAVNVPKSARDQYGLPGQVVHRIVRIGHDSGGLFLITKGDANSGADVFQTRPGEVVGKVALEIPGAGYPFLFFSSRQGKLFLGVAGLIVLLYFLLGLFEDRRAHAEGTVLAMQTVLDETQELRRAITNAERLGARPALDQFADEIRAMSMRSDESARTVRELVAAVSDYGQHLRSHTEVMKNLATTTAELSHATSLMRSALEERRSTRTFVPSHELLERTSMRTPTRALPQTTASGRVSQAELDRLLDETAVRIKEASGRREQLRRTLGDPGGWRE